MRGKRGNANALSAAEGRDKDLPGDGCAGALAARVRGPISAAPPGRDPRGRRVRHRRVSRRCATLPSAATRRRAAQGRGERIGALGDILANTPPDGARCDPAVAARAGRSAGVKAAGVTFVVLDAGAGDRGTGAGRPGSAARIRDELERPSAPTQVAETRLGGSRAADRGADRRRRMVAISGSRHRARPRDLHQAQPMSAVGCGADTGFHAHSHWNNPEPEVVLDRRLRRRSSARRSAMTSTCAISRAAARCCWARPRTRTPPRRSARSLRLFDASFTLDDVRAMEISLTIEGNDNYRLEGRSTMARSAAIPPIFPRSCSEPHHTYPDGSALFFGTLFAPTAGPRRAGPGLHPQGRRRGRGRRRQAWPAGQPHEARARLRALGVRNVGADAQSGAARRVVVIPTAAARESLSAEPRAPHAPRAAR